jgi:hypothetical protein
VNYREEVSSYSIRATPSASECSSRFVSAMSRHNSPRSTSFSLLPPRLASFGFALPCFASPLISPSRPTRWAHLTTNDRHRFLIPGEAGLVRICTAPLGALVWPATRCSVCISSGPPRPTRLPCLTMNDRCRFLILEETGLTHIHTSGCSVRVQSRSFRLNTMTTALKRRYETAVVIVRQLRL